MPSAKVLAAKQAVVAGLADELRSAKTLVVADARGLTVAEDTELRAALRKGGVTYKVVKNTLVSRAAAEANLDELCEVFKGPTAIAYSESDVVAPAKLLKEYADKFKVLELKGGATEGRVVPLSEINALASIPSVEVLYAKLVGGLISPLAALAIYLNEIVKKCEEAGVSTAAGICKDTAPAAEVQDDAEAEKPADVQTTETPAQAPAPDAE